MSKKNFNHMIISIDTEKTFSKYPTHMKMSKQTLKSTLYEKAHFRRIEYTLYVKSRKKNLKT